MAVLKLGTRNHILSYTTDVMMKIGPIPFDVAQWINEGCKVTCFSDCKAILYFHNYTLEAVTLLQAAAYANGDVTELLEKCQEAAARVSKNSRYCDQDETLDLLGKTAGGLYEVAGQLLGYVD